MAGAFRDIASSLMIGGCLLVTSCAPATRNDDVAEDFRGIGAELEESIASWRVPPEKSYEQLTVAQKEMVRSFYENMPAADEPPFPKNGMADIRDGYKEIQSAALLRGAFFGLALIDASGKAVSMKIYKTPDPSINGAMTLAVLRVPFKPGMCSGEPCAMEFPVIADFAVDSDSHNFHIR